MDKREFKVGDRVWSLLFGWGTVKEKKCKDDYPIKVVFDSGRHESHTFDGFWSISNKNPSLFFANQGKIEFDTDEPIELVDGQPIWVRDVDGQEWLERHFRRHGDSGVGVYCYKGGRSKHTSKGCETYWNIFRTTDPALDGASQLRVNTTANSEPTKSFAVDKERQ